MKYYPHLAVSSLPRNVKFIDSISSITPTGIVAVFDVYRDDSGKFFYFVLINHSGIRLIVRSVRASYSVLGNMAYFAGLR